MTINLEQYNGKPLTIAKATEIFGCTILDLMLPKGAAERKIREIQPYGSILLSLINEENREATISYTWDSPYEDIEDPLCWL